MDDIENYKKWITDINLEGLSKDEKWSFYRILEFLTEFFEEVENKPCHDQMTAMKNRKQYVEFDNEMIHLLIHSRYEYSTPEVKGWSFTIAQIELKEKFRRRGICTFLLKWVVSEMPMSFLFAECVLTESMQCFLKKMNANQTSYSHQNYFILKKN